MITKLVHMGIQVNSFSKARAFYCDGLGCEFIYSGTIGEFRHIINPSVDPASDSREQMGYVRIAQGQYFEIFEGMVAPPDFQPTPVNKHDDMSFVEIGLEVASLPDAVKRLEQRGITVINQCIFDDDKNRYRLIEKLGPIKKHIITGLAYVAMKVNDIEAAVSFYKTLGLIPQSADAQGNVEMKAPVMGSLFLIKSDKYVRKYTDTVLGHLCFLTDSFEELRQCAESWEKQNIPCYRNSNKDEILKTSPKNFNPDKGPDGTIGLRVFDTDDNFVEIVYMPPDNRQRRFEQTHPFD